MSKTQSFFVPASLLIGTALAIISNSQLHAQQKVLSGVIRPDDVAAAQAVTNWGCHIRLVQSGFGARAPGQPGYEADLKLPDCQPDRTGLGVIPNSSGRARRNTPAANNLINHGGPVMPTATDYFISLNCGGNFSCWGNPAAFITDLYAPGDNFIHIVDQYVNSSANGRYSLSGTAWQFSGQTEPHSMLPADIQALVISAVRGLFPNGGGGGYDKLYSIFLPSGQDTCFNGGTQCYSPDNPSTFFFCAYHSFMDTTDAKGNPVHVIYAVEPYQNVSGCQVAGGPNGTAIDSTNNTVSHEHFEALSDPDLNAWFDSGGNEIGDKCNFMEVTFTINVDSYRVQSEWDNITSACQTVFQNPFPPPPPGVASSCNPDPRLVDFNGDGKADLLLRRNDGVLQLYFMNGLNIASSATIGQIGVEWSLLAAADYDGDGKADLLVRRNSDGLLGMYLMNGAQITNAKILGQIGTEWKKAGVGDFNGDGRADLLLRRDDGLLAMYLFNGFNIIGAQVIGQIGPEWALVGVADFDGDGKADMLFRRTADGLLALYLMNGFNIKTAAILGNIGVEWTLESTGDFNGDGKADMLFRNLSTGDIALYLMNGTTITTGKVLGHLGVEWGTVGSGDVSGSGFAALHTRRSDGWAGIYLFNGFNITGFNVLGNIGTEFSSCVATAVR